MALIAKMLSSGLAVKRPIKATLLARKSHNCATAALARWRTLLSLSFGARHCCRMVTAVLLQPVF